MSPPQTSSENDSRAARAGMAGIARVAILGCGPRAMRAILPAIRETALDLVAVSESHVGRLQEARRSFGARRGHASHEQLLAREMIDFAIIGDAPDAMEAAAAAIQRGVPALFGLPPADFRSEAATELAVRARMAKVELGLISWPRFDDATQQALRAIDDRVTGRRVSTSVRALRSLPLAEMEPTERLLGSFLGVLDIALHITGTLERVVFDRIVIDGVLRCTAMAHTSSGDIATIDIAAIPRGGAQRWTIDHVGTHGRISLQGSGQVELEHWDDEPSHVERAPARRSEMTVYQGAGRVNRGFENGAVQFAEALRSGRPFRASLESFLPAIHLAETLGGPVGQIDKRLLADFNPGPA